MNSFAYVHDLQMAGDIADGLGEAADAAAFRARAAQRTLEFHAAFFKPASSTYGLGTQSELSIALWLGAPPTPEIAAAVFANLISTTFAMGSTPKQLVGIVGERYFYDVLAAYGRADVGVRILSDDTFPSFGFMVQGTDNPELSSTIWEIWSAFNGDPLMSSRNHLMFVSYATFLLKMCCGVEPIGSGFRNGALIWPIGLGLLNNSQSLVPFASGSMTTPRGEVGVSWSTLAPPTPAGIATCGESGEAPAPAYNFVSVGCDEGSTIRNISFANFGTSKGSCGGAPFAVNPECSAANSSVIVSAACTGKQNCSVAADIRVFGDPCSGTPKHLAINVTCDGSPPPPPAGLVFLGSLSVLVPVNLPATVRVPTFGLAAARIVITEGTAGKASDPRVFGDGTFVPGVDGVTAAIVAPLLGPAGAVAIDLAVGSGSFAFTVWQSEQGPGASPAAL